MKRRKVWALGLWTAVISTGWIISAVLGASDLVAFGVPAILFLLVGGFLTVRVPHNLIGPILVIGASAWLIYDFGNVYSGFSLDSGRSLPGEYVAAWLGAWTGPLYFLSIPALLLLFPDGRFAGKRRWFLGVLAGIAAMALVGAVQVWGLPPEVLADNGPDGILTDRTEYALVDLAFLLGLWLAVPAAGSLVVGYRSSGSIERQQIKGLMVAALVFASALVVGLLVFESSDLSAPAIAIGMSTLPLAIGMAVFRYRLYDVDRIISRTVSYALVVGVLAETMQPASVGVWVKEG